MLKDFNDDYLAIRLDMCPSLENILPYIGELTSNSLPEPLF